MSGIKEFIGNVVIQRMINKVMGSGLMQEETNAQGCRYITEGMPETARQAAAEGCVLLKNDGTLPLRKDHEVSVFGRCQLDWFYVGYGSGGDVSAPYYVNLSDAMDRAGVPYNRELASAYRTWCSSGEHKASPGWWGNWPLSYPEMPLDEAMIQKAAQENDTALIIIGRAAGEDLECTLEKGSFYLTDEETRILDMVTDAFPHTVVILNTGNVMDLSWTKRYGDKISALLAAWFGGMESGNAVCDVLYGDTPPSGRLSDSIAFEYNDYPSSANFGGKDFNEYKEDIFIGYRYFDRYAPEKILFPFGHGLSYTTFSLIPQTCEYRDGKITVSADVINTGAYDGKEVLMLWCNPPEEGLSKPKRILSGFIKTPLLKPQESFHAVLSCGESVFASFDEAIHAFVLDAGEYTISLNDKECCHFTIGERKILQQLEPVMTKDVPLKKRILENLPKELQASKNGALRFEDVADGTETLEEFIAALSLEELEALTRGHGMMSSSYGTSGNAGAFGGIIPSLQEKGVPPLITSDGPSGLRLNHYAALLPSGTTLACTWNTELVEDLYRLLAKEMQHYEIDVLLAPGMNIHRNPLCGRNFEYYSEDPLLSGKTAAAAVKGIQSNGRAACVKHFSCNNQETKRNTNDSRVSERALREIYLKNFEICIWESHPLTVMTSYNKVNGIWSHYNYDLATTVLRKQWGYDGTVLTDWWMKRSASPEFPSLKNNAYRVRAQVDILMPGDMRHIAKQYKADKTLLSSYGKPEGITKGELQRTAKNVLTLVLRIKRIAK